MKTILFALHFSCLLIVTAGGSVYTGFGCPEGRKVGEPWFLKPCGKCECNIRGHYGCISCQQFNIKVPGCYQISIRSSNYPDCCEFRLVCKGDEDFDESSQTIA